MSDAYGAAREIRQAIRSLAEEMNASRLEQAQADYLDHTPYYQGQSVFVSFHTPDQSSVHGTVWAASPVGLILVKVKTISGLFIDGYVLVPWSSISYVALSAPSSQCPWLEAAPED